MADSIAVNLNINGELQTANIDPKTTLLQVLREDFRLTGAKNSCNQGVCGTCSVLVDGKSLRACLSLAVAMQDREIITIEGLGDEEQLDPVQQAFIDEGAVQCGYCMPAMVITAKSLLTSNSNPSMEEIRHAMGSNLCRCSGYVKVIDAVRRAANGATT